MLRGGAGSRWLEEADHARRCRIEMEEADHARRCRIEMVGGS